MQDNAACGLIQVVSEIRASIKDETLWPRALDAIAAHLHARFVVLVFQDSASALLELKHSSDTRKDWILEYLRSHRRLNALQKRVVDNAMIGVPLMSGDFMPPARFRRSGAFERWLAPHGLSDIAGSVIHRSMNGACLLIACFADELDEEAKTRFSALTAAFATAFTNRDVKQDGSALLHALFDALDAPIIVVDAVLNIRFANRAGRGALSCNDGLSDANGVLSIADRDARDALRLAMAGGAPSNGAVMLRHGDARCCVIYATRLAGGVFALLLRRVASQGPSGDGVAASVYGLTARERSVLLAIAEVGGVPATARALGLTEGTVRGYLKSVFRKTGARRQADLVKLELALRSPFRSKERVVEPKSREMTASARTDISGAAASEVGSVTTLFEDENE